MRVGCDIKTNSAKQRKTAKIEAQLDAATSMLSAGGHIKPHIILSLSLNLRRIFVAILFCVAPVLKLVTAALLAVGGCCASPILQMWSPFY